MADVCLSLSANAVMLRADLLRGCRESPSALFRRLVDGAPVDTPLAHLACAARGSLALPQLAIDPSKRKVQKLRAAVDLERFGCLARQAIGEFAMRIGKLFLARTDGFELRL